MKEEVFTIVNLPLGGKATILEGKGTHYFSATVKANGNSDLFVKFLIMELVLINGKKLTEEQLNELHMRDIHYLTNVISTMLADFDTIS